MAFVVKTMYFWISTPLPEKKNLVLAHEMGHVLLGHLLTDHLARDESPCGEVIYRELLADVFSAVLMALCAYGAAGNDKEEK